MELLDVTKQMSDLLENIQLDLAKSKRGNKSAAQRVRINTIKFSKIALEFRRLSVEEDSLEELASVQI